MNPDLADFHAFLYRFPSLGLAHEQGHEIRDHLRQIPLMSLDQRSWYRGIEQKQKPSFHDFLPPEPQKVELPEQRFNHQGERVFYLAESARGAALECADDQGAIVWVQRIRVAGAEKI